MSGKVLIEARGVTKRFPVKGGGFRRSVGEVRAVDDVDLQVFEKESLGLVGESGCGKSTLGRLLLRLLDADAGEIIFEGADIAGMKEREFRPMRRAMQIIFQDPYSSLDPRTPIGESIAEGLRVHGVPKDERRRRALDALELVGLEPYHYRRFPHEFSGGQRQRIGIARALAVQPKFLVCDEPVSALDVSIQSQILNLLKQLQQDLDLTVLFIAHNLSVVEHLCDRIAVMYLGRIAEIGTREEIFERPVHPYTQALLSAIPVPDPTRVKRQILLKGEIPSPVNPPPGCLFHTRCPIAEDGVCNLHVPGLREVDGEPGHRASCHLRTGDYRHLGGRWARMGVMREG